MKARVLSELCKGHTNFCSKFATWNKLVLASASVTQ